MGLSLFYILIVEWKRGLCIFVLFFFNLESKKYIINIIFLKDDFNVKVSPFGVFFFFLHFHSVYFLFYLFICLFSILNHQESLVIFSLISEITLKC